MCAGLVTKSLVLGALMLGSMSYADTSEKKLGGHVGGGDAAASDLQNIINNIDAYLLTDEGKEEFPEIKQPKFHKIVKTVRPVVKDERVKDQFGITQTCISHVEEGNRYIQCDLKRLPQLGQDTQPTLYRMMFHELLFQVGIEKPINKDVPSDFRTSSKLKLHLNRNDEWAVGEAKEYHPKGSSAYNRAKLKYQVTLSPFGLDYRENSPSLSFAKFLGPDSVLALKVGNVKKDGYQQFNSALQFKYFMNNSFYFTPEIFFLDYKINRKYIDDYHYQGLGTGIRVGNQWQWENFTLGVDWLGLGATLVNFKNNTGDGLITVNFLNVYLGWSF